MHTYKEQKWKEQGVQRKCSLLYYLTWLKGIENYIFMNICIYIYICMCVTEMVQYLSWIW